MNCRWRRSWRRARCEQEPNYAFVSARLLLDPLRRESLSFISDLIERAPQAEMSERYASYFPAFIATGIEAELIDPELGRFDLAKLGAALKPERDLPDRLDCHRSRRNRSRSA